jgi:hypothetical protein
MKFMVATLAKAKAALLAIADPIAFLSTCSLILVLTQVFIRLESKKNDTYTTNKSATQK